MPTAAAIRFDNSYVRLPGRFYARLDPTPVRAPRGIRVNRGLARELGIDPDWLASDAGVEVVAGNRVPEGAEPIATAYAGHQFGGFVGQLGDGRAILLGEVVSEEGTRHDVQLKGSGRTPFSRAGDGRAPLGPVLREYVVSEAMSALGIPTTRALAAVFTGEAVLRDRREPGAVLARVARSHIRIGTFEFFAARGDRDGLELLAEHVIDRHVPEAREAPNPVRAMLDGVVGRQAELVASWMGVGFIHGVMNTDNVLLSGETIDYGPCAFMDGYHPSTVYSSIDLGGRYAYGNQPSIMHWNLGCLAQALRPILDDDPKAALATAQEAIDAFPDRFEEAYRGRMCDKLGISEPEVDDEALVAALLAIMAEERADHTLTFRRLADLAAPEGDPGPEIGALHQLSAAFSPWLVRWRDRLARDPLEPGVRAARMRRASPAFIPRNHLVEHAIRAAVHDDDLGPFDDLLHVLARPFDYSAEHASHAAPPLPEQVVSRTFCGT